MPGEVVLRQQPLNLQGIGVGEHWDLKCSQRAVAVADERINRSLPAVDIRVEHPAHDFACDTLSLGCLPHTGQSITFSEYPPPSSGRAA